MLEVKFERAKRYIGRMYLERNKTKYEDITRSLYSTKKVTRSNLDFLLDYHKKSESINGVLPSVPVSKETGITVFMNPQGKLRVQKYSYSYISLDD